MVPGLFDALFEVTFSMIATIVVQDMNSIPVFFQHIISYLMIAESTQWYIILFKTGVYTQSMSQEGIAVIKTKKSVLLILLVFGLVLLGLSVCGSTVMIWQIHRGAES